MFKLFEKKIKDFTYQIAIELPKLNDLGCLIR